MWLAHLVSCLNDEHSVVLIASRAGGLLVRVTLYNRIYGGVIFQR